MLIVEHGIYDGSINIGGGGGGGGGGGMVVMHSPPTSEVKDQILT